MGKKGKKSKKATKRKKAKTGKRSKATSGGNKNVVFAQEELDRLRKVAKNTPLSILVWGPGDDGSKEYDARCVVRDELNRIGHDARFSEELCRQESALDDSIEDEILQAKIVDAIVIIYGNGGTQTETDSIIIPHKDIAQKTTILVADSTLTSIYSSVSSNRWRELGREAEIIDYSKLPLEEDVLSKVRERMQKLREAKFLKSLDTRKIPEGQKKELRKQFAVKKQPYEVAIGNIESSVLGFGDPTSELKYRIIEVYR